MFQLTKEEKDELVPNWHHLENLQFSYVNLYAFTEQGMPMLSAVLTNGQAISVCIKIMNAFVEMRKFLVSNAQIFQRLDTIELKQLKTEEKLDKVFDVMEQNQIVPKQGIFFERQCLSCQ